MDRKLRNVLSGYTCGHASIIVAWAFLFFVPLPSRGQSLWEVTPYRIHTLVTTETDARVPDEWTQALVTQLPGLAQSRLGAVWTLTAAETPLSFRKDVISELPISPEQLVASDPELRKIDKLYFVVIGYELDTYRIRVREWDIATRQWSPVLQRKTTATSRMAQVALQMMCQVFSPLVRIETIGDDSLSAAVRAGALARPEKSARSWLLPTEIEPGDVLKPVIRRSDRNGNVTPKGVEVVKWTVLVVQSRIAGRLECTWQSGYRQPFRTRRSSRVQQLAVRIQPRFSSTTLQLVDRKEPDQPLVGYAVYSKPNAEAASVLVGRTDWRGRLNLERDPDHPVRILYVRNGKQLLGKLPIVPGDERELIAPLRNDDVRLEAEGFLLGIQESLVDLVARREVLAARIRRHIEEGEFDEAADLIKELRGLDTQEDFARRVQQRQRGLTSVDAQVRQKVDELFVQTRSMLAKYLDREQVNQLARDLEQARSGASNSDPVNDRS